MTAPHSPEPSAVWGRSRILVTTALLATVQGILFLSLSHWPALPTPPVGKAFTMKLDPRPQNRVGAEGWSADPRQFSANLRETTPPQNPRSGGGSEYPLFRWESSPRWLEASSGIEWRPGPDGQARQDRQAGRTIDGPIPGPAIRPLLLKGETSIALRGDLASLAFEAATPPPVSMVEDILPSTVVELVVGPGGDVIRSRLVEGCGNADADRAALAWSRGLRFITGSGQAGPGIGNPAEWRTGELVLRWNTRPAPQR
ncbi:MAG: energy transducer TonB [Verrucomicrobiota bacterium]